MCTAIVSPVTAQASSAGGFILPKNGIVIKTLHGLQSQLGGLHVHPIQTLDSILQVDTMTTGPDPLQVRVLTTHAHTSARTV